MSHSAWHTFLTTQGAQFDADGQASFAEHAQALRVYDVSSLGLIAVSGDDAFTFLQGQLTNDIKQVAEGAQFTGYCTAKGRLLALFYAFSHEGTLYLQCPKVLVSQLVKRLSMFVLRSKVQVRDASTDFVAFGLSAPDLTSVLPECPERTHVVRQSSAGIFIRLPDSGGVQRAQLWIAAGQAEQTWTTLSSQFSATSSDAWEALDIQAGIPQIIPATQEQFVPQMVNLDALDGINFKKGCYTGQEIVARTHYLGKVKRRSMLATVSATGAVPKPGDALLDAQQQEAGQLVRVASHTAGGYWLLAECRLEAYEAGVVTWQGQALTFHPLPYALP